MIVQGMNLLHNWLSEKEIRFVSTTQLLDFSGAMGLMMANMLLAFGQIEQEARRERQAIGITRAKAEGKYLGTKAGRRKGKPSRAAALIAKGNTIEEAGKSLGVSTRTIKRYLKESA
ncbi:MAG: hypothetical protein COA78_36215 [Blastopirellula sp.]|nr:MAG: hypothetical protein COA78_36215 [Blastopirellula sp.]